MARPRKTLNNLQLTKLAALGATVGEMADFFGVSPDTLERRFAGQIAKGTSNLKIRLRRLQLRAAEKGSVAMLIFLGKALLGQHEDGANGEIPNIQVIWKDADSPAVVADKTACGNQDRLLSEWVQGLEGFALSIKVQGLERFAAE